MPACNGKKIGESVYSSANYQADQENGKEPDEPTTEAYFTLRIVEDLPEEKSCAEVVNAQWRFTADGIEQKQNLSQAQEAELSLLTLVIIKLFFLFLYN